jgi:hypothetical protein
MLDNNNSMARKQGTCESHNPKCPNRGKVVDVFGEKKFCRYCYDQAKPKQGKPADNVERQRKAWDLQGKVFTLLNTEAHVRRQIVALLFPDDAPETNNKMST